MTYFRACLLAKQNKNLQFLPPRQVPFIQNYSNPRLRPSSTGLYVRLSVTGLSFLQLRKSLMLAISYGSIQRIKSLPYHFRSIFNNKNTTFL